MTMAIVTMEHRAGVQTSGEEAIAWLRERVENNLRFSGDVEFVTLIADLDAAERP